MQNALRPYATAGIALVGASVIAVTPLTVAPLPSVHTRPVQLVDAWSTLLTDTTANLTSIAGNADPTAISGVFSALLSNPLGVIDALTNLTPTVTGELASGLTVQLPPGLELGIADLGAWATTLNAVSDVVGQLQSDPSGALTTLIEAPATILNGYLNGEDNISLLNGIIDITGFNGILAPLQDVSINLNLTSLIDALGLGNLSLSSLDLSGLLSQLGLGNLDLGGLFSALGLSTEGLGTLLGDPTLSSLLGDLGLGNLGLGSFNLTDILSGLGLDTSLNSLSLDSVLNAFGINTEVTGGLTGLLKDLGLSSLVNESLGSLIATLPSGLLNGVVSSLNDVLGTVLAPLVNAPVLGPEITALLASLNININDLLTVGNLESALSGVTVGDLLGGQTFDTTVSALLGDLGVSVPTSGLTIGGILTDLGADPSTADLTLGGLLTDLGVGGTGLTAALNTVDLGTLLNDLGISDTALNLSNLGDISNLTLDGLLGDLGLGNLGTISVDGFGGLVTELVDVIPQQILAAL
ncbi:MAG: hypothetical protein WBV80_22570 [Mycobacterium sp.]